MRYANLAVMILAAIIGWRAYSILNQFPEPSVFVGPPEPLGGVGSCIAYLMQPTFKRPDGSTMPVEEARSHFREVWFHYAREQQAGVDPCVQRIPLRIAMNGRRQMDSRLRRDGVTYVKCDGKTVRCRNVGEPKPQRVACAVYGCNDGDPLTSANQCAKSRHYRDVQLVYKAADTYGVASPEVP